VVPRSAASAEVSAQRHADWLVLTSVNALDAIAEPHGRVAVVGSATAAAATDRGHHVALVAPDGTAASLVEALGPGPGSVLVVQASVAMPTVAEGLRTNGWSVEVVSAYDTIRAPRLDALMPRIASATAIVFTSPSTAQNFVEMYGLSMVPPAVVTIGPTTVAACERLGIDVTQSATERDPASIIEAVLSAVGAS
jgi:uroporphyrinogen-III synthase